MEFKDLNKKGKLSEVANRFGENEDKWIEALKNGGDPRIASMVLWGVNQSYALKSFFVDKDTEQAKQRFYTCGKLDEFLTIKYDEKVLDYGINHLSYTLLSDNEALIRRYADLRHSKYEAMIKNGVAAPVYILQCIMKEDWKEYERVMVIMKNKTAKKFKMEMDAAYYEALAERDKNRLEEILAEFVTPKIHKQRNKVNELINEFISHPAIGYAKLAWLKGIEVSVNSSLIPKELLPIIPNKEYKDSYTFLKGL